MSTERINALETALQNEMKEREFYLQQAERTSNPLGRSMFLQIAAEELEHHQRLQDLHDKWQSSGRWPEDLPLTVKGSNLKNTLNKFLDEKPYQIKADQDDLAAIRTAIAFESRGCEFYENLSQAVEDEKERSFFKLLASIEKEHLDSLIKTEAFFIDPAAWYQEYEHSGLDGA